MTDKPKGMTMFHKMLFAVSFISLFIQACSVAQTKNIDLTYKAGPEKNSIASTNIKFLPLLPVDNFSPIAGEDMNFNWTEIASAARYRLEVEDGEGKSILSAETEIGTYHVPSWKLEGRDSLRWRIVAFDQAGKMIGETPWRALLPLSSVCEIW